MGQLLISSGVPPQSPISFIIAGLLLMAAVIPLSVSRLQTPPFENAPAMSVFALWRRVPLGVFAAFAGGVLIHSFYALVPLYGALTELSTDRIAQLMSLSVLTAMAWAWPIGWLCDRVLRSNVLIGISILVVLMALVASLLGRADFWILVIAGSVIMACIAAMYSVGVAITNDIVSQEERIGASAALMFAYGAGSVMGPLGGSWLMEYIGPSALFLGFAAVGSFLAIYTYYRQLMLPPVDLEEQEEFVVSSPEASVNVELDPRTDELTASSIEDLFPENMLEDKNTPS
jgi:MFS family permease